MASRLVDRARSSAVLAIQSLSKTGEHAWRTTQEMEPGIRAGNLDANTRGWRYEEVPSMTGGVEVMPLPNDTTGEAAIATPDETAAIHERYRRLLYAVIDSTTALTDFLGSLDPARARVVPDAMTDADWCRVHLTIGVCEPRNRGDLCHFCYRFKLAHDGVEPPRALVQLRHEKGGRITQRDIDAVLAPPRGHPHPHSKRGRRRARRQAR